MRNRPDDQRNYWGSDAADTDGSRNVVGIKNYAVDGLIESLINASDREELITITKALDRVLLWNYYVIPQWHISSYRVLYWDFFDQPKIKPKFHQTDKKRKLKNDRLNEF